MDIGSNAKWKGFWETIRYLASLKAETARAKAAGEAAEPKPSTGMPGYVKYMIHDNSDKNAIGTKLPTLNTWIGREALRMIQCPLLHGPRCYQARNKI